MANIDQVQLPDGSQYRIIDDTSGYATTAYVQDQISTINKNTIGLGNVDNTADINKPVSLPQQDALNGKVDDDLVAYAQSDTTATKRYEVGDQFILNGVLYTATAIIAVNDTIVIGTNCEVSDTLVEQNDALSARIDTKVSKSGDTMSGNLIIDQANGTTSTAGSSAIKIGNATPTGTAGNSYGIIHLCSNTAYRANITAPNFTADRNINMPNGTGTLALKEDFAWTAMSATAGTNITNLSVNYNALAGNRYLIKGSFKVGSGGIAANSYICTGGSIAGQGAVSYACPYASSGVATYLNGAILTNAALTTSGGNSYTFCGVIN